MIYELRTTSQYDKWFAGLKDSTLKIKVLARLNRVENGNLGDSKQIGTDLFELRFIFGAGLRIYYTVKEHKVILLLSGGDKSSQSKDIKKAAELLDEFKE